MDSLLPILQEVLGRYPRVSLAIVFGSRATGRARPGSDVDVAYAASPPLSLAEEHALGADLERALGAPVDLVSVDEASAALRWRIARDGLVVVSNPPQRATRFLAQVGIEHDELSDLHREASRRFRARLAATPRTDP